MAVLSRGENLLHISHLVPLKWSNFSSSLGLSGMVSWVANPLENNCENINTHTHGGVGIFSKEMKLELMWINSAMKQRREGFETSPAECSPIDCGQSDGATSALYRKDRVSQSAPDAGHTVTELWPYVQSVAAVSARSRSRDRMLAQRVTIHSGPTSGQCWRTLMW